MVKAAVGGFFGGIIMFYSFPDWHWFAQMFAGGIFGVIFSVLAERLGF